MARLMVAAVAVCGFVLTAPAQEKKADKADPTGTWKYETEINGQKRERTIKLELKDGKLTGAQIGMNNMETAISDATFKDGEVAFTVVQERNNMKITTKYKGKIDGDTFKGTAESDRGGTATKTEFTAKKEKK